MNSQEFSSIDEQFERIKSVFGLKSDSDIAQLFEVGRNNVSFVRARGTRVPSRWLFDSLEKVGLNPFWVLTGCGPKYFVAADQKTSKDKDAAAAVMLAHNREIRMREQAKREYEAARARCRRLGLEV